MVIKVGDKFIPKNPVAFQGIDLTISRITWEGDLILRVYAVGYKSYFSVNHIRDFFEFPDCGKLIFVTDNGIVINMGRNVFLDKFECLGLIGELADALFHCEG